MGQRREEPQAECWGPADRHRLLVCHNCNEKPEATQSCFDEGDRKYKHSPNFDNKPLAWVTSLEDDTHGYNIWTKERLQGRQKAGGEGGEASMPPPTGSHLLKGPITSQHHEHTGDWVPSTRPLEMQILANHSL